MSLRTCRTMWNCVLTFISVCASFQASISSLLRSLLASVAEFRPTAVLDKGSPGVHFTRSLSWLDMLFMCVKMWQCSVADVQHVTVLSCYSIVMLQYCHVTVLSCYSIVMLQYCHVTVLSCYSIVMLQYCHVTVLSCYSIVMLQYCHACFDWCFVESVMSNVSPSGFVRDRISTKFKTSLVFCFWACEECDDQQWYLWHQHVYQSFCVDDEEALFFFLIVFKRWSATKLPVGVQRP